MTEIAVTPEDLQTALDRANPGDRIQLLPGQYDSTYTISRRHGHISQPITIEAAPDVDPADCQISAGVSADAFRPLANRLAQRAKDIGYSFPGLYPWIDDARLRVYRCRHVVIRNLRFSQSWPTHIFIDQSLDITIKDCAFQDATFCIGAGGATTRDITIERCSWTQDTVPGRLWQRIPWDRVHSGDVDLERDYRLFDGDFFRSNEIQGGVTIRYCSIKAAFNAIHGFNEPAAAPLNRDFHIHHNHFEEIRDNVFEPEDGAANWWFHHNHMVDVHKWFSIECHTRGPMYIFANTASFRSQQGVDPLPGEQDDKTGGAAFKVIKTVEAATGPFAPVYVFHNSFVTRSKYIKKGLLPGLEHVNNAIQYRAAPGEDTRTGGFFGKPSEPEYAGRFTSGWDRWQIRFDGDVIGFPGFDEELKPVGYPLGRAVKPESPRFIGPGHQPDEFEVPPDSPCHGTSIPFSVETPSGTWHAPGGAHVGALQGHGQRFDGPAFEPTLPPGANDLLS